MNMLAIEMQVKLIRGYQNKFSYSLLGFSDKTVAISAKNEVVLKGFMLLKHVFPSLWHIDKN